MKTVIIGGSGLIGSKLVTTLRQQGHDVVSAALDTGVNTLTGEGLDGALAGAEVVVDVSNSPSFDDEAAMHFFQTSTSNLLAAEAVAGVRHHVVLSVVGTDRLLASGYFRAKMAQETLIRESAIPYTIVRATQFFEFIRRLADGSMDGGMVRLAPALIQPMAADDVASAVGRSAVGLPENRAVEVGGPQQFRMDELVRRTLSSLHDPRPVVTDPTARYFGAVLGERTLLPGADARIGETSLSDWLAQPSNRPVPVSAESPRTAAAAPVASR